MQHVQYLIDFHRFYEHLGDVEMRFHATQDAPQLWMPTWIAGSYLIREFSKNITKVSYQIHNQTFVADKLNKNTFILSQVRAGDEVVVRYEVYCRDLSVRTAFVDHTRIFGNFSSLLLFIENQHDTPAQVTLCVPKAFCAHHQLACGLAHSETRNEYGTQYQLAPLPAFDYIDYPFEIGAQDSFEFSVTDAQQMPIAHRFFLTGKHYANLDRLKSDLQKICQTYLNWLGDAPFTDYTFMTMVTGNDYGGLEHINSTALISPRGDMPALDEAPIPSADYQRFLGLCSHEYFHAWWVKSVRPDVMMENLLQHESYTPLLWVFEGFTSYLDDLMLLASGVIDKASYLKLLTAQINRYHQTDGKAHQSVAESSFDTWIKLYRADENTSNQGVSYYNKGALVALLLDLTLLEKSDGRYRLFDVVKAFYQRAKQAPNRRYAMHNDNLSELLGQMMGADNWQNFYQRFVIGTEALPLQQMLAAVDVHLHHASTQKPWGMSFDENKMGLKIKHLHRQSAASLAGLSVGDQIIAIDGLKASEQILKNTIHRQSITQESVTIHAFRRDELLSLQVPAVITERAHSTLTGEGGDWLRFCF